MNLNKKRDLKRIHQKRVRLILARQALMHAWYDLEKFINVPGVEEAMHAIGMAHRGQ